MNFEVVAQLSLVLINGVGLLLAWWVFDSGSSRDLKQWFFLMTLFILLWANFSYFGSRTEDVYLSESLYRMNWAAVSLFFPSFYYFYVIHFLKKKGLANALGIVIIIISVLLLAASLFSDLIINGVILRDWGMEVSFGSLSLIFNIFSVMVAAIVSIYSLRGFNQRTKEEKARLGVFLAGIFIFISANLIFNVFTQVLFNSVQYQILGDFSSIFLLGFTAYATIQYKLFDVKVFTAQAITAMLLVLLLSRVVTSEDNSVRIVDFAIFLTSTFFGYLLIRSVKKEIGQREQLETLTDRLKELDARKDEFLNVAAHELRAPMTAIKGYLSMLKKEDEPLSDDAREMLDEAVNENDRLVRLVNNMLDVSRIEEGRMTFEMGELSLVEVVEKSFKQFKPNAKEKGLAYEIKVGAGIRSNVYVDVDRIYEVVNNLISNAIKYTDKGNIVVLLSNPNPSKIRFEVKDTGKGLSESEIRKLFSKFYRAESSLGKSIGTGLGLYISKLLIKHFGGQIGVNSKAGKGSSFWFELPLKN